MSFSGILPAVTTPFSDGDEVDTAALAANVSHLVEHGAPASWPPARWARRTRCRPASGGW